MSTKKATTTKQTPVHTIRVGEISALIHLRKSNAGYAYYDYILERNFAMATGRQATGTSFFDRSSTLLRSCGQLVLGFAKGSSRLSATSSPTLWTPLPNRPTRLPGPGDIARAPCIRTSITPQALETD
jgi:hypothetical protein